MTAPEPVATRFAVGDLTCVADHYRPAAVPDGGAPCVVLGHGMTGTRRHGLPRFARAFARGGVAALVFDYRGFGGSQGSPRQRLDVRAQRADFDAAVAHARRLEEVDPARVAVWGTSFGAGHALSVAARDRSVAAAVLLVPAARIRFPILARVLRAAARDRLAAARGRAPHEVRVVDEPRGRGLITEPGALAVMERLRREDDSGWRNAVALGGLFTDDGTGTGRTHAPVMVCAAREDGVAAPGTLGRFAASSPTVEMRSYPGRHFGTYVDETADTIAADQTDFLQRHLSVAPPGGGER